MFLNKYSMEPTTDGAIITLYLNELDTEFAKELGTVGTSNTIQDELGNYVLQRFPNMKIRTIKIVAGGILLGIFSTESFLHSTKTAHAAEPTQAILASTYIVQEGDSLSVIAKRLNTTVNELKSANNLTTDTIHVGQSLKIPNKTTSSQAPSPNQPIQNETISTSYTVANGDSLSVIAKKLNISVNAIKTANNLTTDTIYVGQSLKIPGKTASSQAPPANQPVQNGATSSTYTVVNGDSLSVIAKKLSTSVNAIKTANNLTTDTIYVGQSLKIPGKTASSQAPQANQPVQNGATSSTYTVVNGDSLSVIAKKLHTSVLAIKEANGLSSDLIHIGQTLKIPGSTTEVKNQTENNIVIPESYTVASGDSLFSIAKRFGLSVALLKEMNNLSSDTIQTGQTLQLKKLPTNQMYTVQSGDTLSGIAKKYGTTTAEIRSMNKLTNDLIVVGQRLTINSHVIVAPSTQNSVSYKKHTVQSGDNMWNLSVKYGMPQAELLKANNLTTSSLLRIGQTLKIPVYTIAVQSTVSERHGEYLDWWTEAQYVFPIGKIATVTDFKTGKSFQVKRTIGANHADTETLTTADSAIAKSIWGGYSWSTRAVIVEVDGRKIAASMTFHPHDVEYIKNNGITGHFDIHFKSSTRHKDGKIDPYHQDKIREAAGITQK